MQADSTTTLSGPAAASVQPAPAPRLHPLVAGAAVAVIAVSVLAGVALVNSQVSARHAVESQIVTAATMPGTETTGPSAQQTPTSVDAPAAKPTTARTPATAPRTADRRATSPAAAAALPPPSSTSSQSPAYYPEAPVAAAPVCLDCGVVTAVREIKTAGQGTGVGAVAGGVLGGVIGNQIGKGNGRDAARVLGAIGGAVAGHQVEKQARATVRYEIDVRMDDGSSRTVARDSAPDLRAGDAVRIDGNRVLHADGRPVALRTAQ